MWSPGRLVHDIVANCALARLLALIGLEALLGLNGRPPESIWPREADTLAESGPFPSDPLAAPRSSRPS